MTPAFRSLVLAAVEKCQREVAFDDATPDPEVQGRFAASIVLTALRNEIASIVLTALRNEIASMDDGTVEWRRGIPSREVVEANTQTHPNGARMAFFQVRCPDPRVLFTVVGSWSTSDHALRWEVPIATGIAKAMHPFRVQPEESWEFRPVDLWSGDARAWPVMT